MKLIFIAMLVLLYGALGFAYWYIKRHSSQRRTIAVIYSTICAMHAIELIQVWLHAWPE